MNALLPILLALSLFTLIGVRFIPRKGRIKHLWLVCCLCNLAIGALLAYRSYESSKAIRDVQQSIQEMQPFELTQEQRGVLLERFTELIEEEKQSGLEEEPVIFELFPQQSLDAENLVRFIHKIFKSAGRKTDITMMYNSGTPTDVRMVMLKIGDPLNPPVLLTRFCQILSDMGIQYKVLISNKIQDRSLIITAQRPVFIMTENKAVRELIIRHIMTTYLIYHCLFDETWFDKPEMKNREKLIREYGSDGNEFPDVVNFERYMACASNFIDTRLQMQEQKEH